MAFVKKFCTPRFDSFAFSPSVDRSGGILTVWCSSHFSGEILLQNKYAISVLLQSTRCESCWTLTNIYAPCQDDKKLEFLAWLDGTHIPEDADWLIVGDFNLIRSLENMNKPEGNISEIMQFNAVISNLGLVDIPLKGRKYTWSNMQDDPLLERLDWFFTSASWTLSYPNTLAFPLARSTFAHVPCVIKIQTTMPKSNIFRFENWWLQQDSFMPLV